MTIDGLLETYNFLKRGADKSTLAQIILPYCSDASRESHPVALLTGNINLKASLRKNGKTVSLEEELEKLDAELQSRTTKSTKGTVIDLSMEMKKLEIENVTDEKEIEIKEEWTEADEALSRNRIPRTVSDDKIIEPVKNVKKSLSEDIDELLRLAELEEEEEQEGGKPAGPASKVQVIKEEVKKLGMKPQSAIKPLNLPKISATNPLVGDVIERESEPISKKNFASFEIDQVSNRIILNDLKRADLKSSKHVNLEELDEKSSETSVNTTAPLKKSSLFSLRKEQPKQ